MDHHNHHERGMEEKSMDVMMDHSGHEHHQHLEMTSQESENVNMHHQVMMMYFHGGYNEVILFDWWRISTVSGLIGSMIAIIIMGIVYESIKFAREHIMRTSGFQPVKPFGRLRRGGRGSDGTNSSSSNTIEETINDDSSIRASPEGEQHEENAIKIVETSMMSYGHFMLTFLYFVQMALAYFLMLIAMTYNTWLFLAVILGAATGYFIFGWRKSAIVETSDHCH